MTTKQNLNPALEEGKQMMTKRRGRKKKTEEDDEEHELHGIVKHVRFKPSEWDGIKKNFNIEDDDKFNFSAFARRVLKEIRPVILDSEVTQMLRAARKDIVNFINAINGMKLNALQRKQLLLSLPTLEQWWPKLEKEIHGIDRFFDILHERGFYSFNKDKEKSA